MGIRFNCRACGFRLNVKEHLAGKRGICPRCKTKLQVPAANESPEGTSPSEGGESDPEPAAALPEIAPVESSEPIESSPPVESSLPPEPSVPLALNSALSDPIAEAPHLTWHAVPPGSTTPYGPAAGELFRQWIAEGRITRDTLVWRSDWVDWRPAGDVLPQLQPTVLPRHAQSVDRAPGVPPTRPWLAAEASVAPRAVALPVKRSNKGLIVGLTVLVVALIPLLWLVLHRG